MQIELAVATDAIDKKKYLASAKSALYTVASSAQTGPLPYSPNLQQQRYQKRDPTAKIDYAGKAEH